ncbi:hypothetical protein ACI8AF_20215 [Blastococcus sp. SYSU D00669]
MSDRVTWEPCPRCGGTAAVGWAPDTGDAAGPASEVPVEFDCTSGCSVTPAELRLLARRHEP